MQLERRGARVIVAPQEGIASLWEHRYFDLKESQQEQIVLLREQGIQLRKELREQGIQLRKELREQGTQLRKELREQGDELKVFTSWKDKLALRRLMDDVRTKINGRELSREQRGDVWNGVIDAMTEMRLAELGLSREEVCLTRFGHGTDQRKGSDAAHGIGTSIVAKTVLSRQGAYVSLFRYAYGLHPNEFS